MTIETELTRLENAKAAIISTLTAKNIEVPSGTKIQGLTALIASLPDVPTPETPEWGAIEYYPTSKITLPGKFSMFDMMSMEEVEVNIVDPAKLADTIITNNINPYDESILVGGVEERYGFQYSPWEGGWKDTYNYNGPYTTSQLGIEDRPYNEGDEIRFKNNSGHWSATGKPTRIEFANQTEWNTFLNANNWQSITIQGQTFRKGAVARVEFGTNCTTVGDRKLTNLAMIKSIGHEENLESVGKGFLAGSYAFDNNNKDLYFENLVSATYDNENNSFSSNLFNKKIEFGTSCTSIFDFFGCGSGITIVIPASVTSISYFMKQNKGGATIIDRSNATISIPDYMLGQYLTSANTADKDFYIKGSGRQKWLNKFPSTGSRNVIDGGEE